MIFCMTHRYSRRTFVHAAWIRMTASPKGEESIQSVGSAAHDKGGLQPSGGFSWPLVLIPAPWFTPREEWPSQRRRLGPLVSVLGLLYSSLDSRMRILCFYIFTANMCRVGHSRFRLGQCLSTPILLARSHQVAVHEIIKRTCLSSPTPVSSQVWPGAPAANDRN